MIVYSLRGSKLAFSGLQFIIGIFGCFSFVVIWSGLVGSFGLRGRVIEKFVLYVMFARSAMEGGVDFVFHMFLMFYFFDGSGNHIHHNKVVGDDRCHTGNIQGRGIFDGSLLNTEGIFDRLISGVRYLVIQITN